MRDSFKRVIRYLRVSVTGRCNLGCAYCSPEGPCSTQAGGELPLESLEAVVAAAVRLGVDKVRITGGEPLLREGIVGFVARLAALSGLKKLSMTTNGTLLAPLAEDLARAGLQSVNVSLDSVDPAEYRSATGCGELADALSGIGSAIRSGLGVKLNCVVDPGDPSADARAATVERYARSLGAVRTSGGRPSEALGAAFQRIRRYDPGAAKVYDPAFDRPPACAFCDRLRLLSDGRLLACLHSSAFVEIDMDRIEDSILECVAMKPERGDCAVMAGLREIGG